MTTALRNANTKPRAFEEHFHQSQQDLYESSGNLLMDVEKKKGKMPAEIYVEFRYYLNSVNDALARAAEAAEAKKWETAREHFNWAETLLTYIKLAVAMDISVSKVMNRWKTKH
ncbi:MAG: hypothetical protein NTZ35_11950 [Ignavibacteriales bacterium]|nr:hypothetical protein [Ignavibacteriales bacterium]